MVVDTLVILAGLLLLASLQLALLLRRPAADAGLAQGLAALAASAERQAAQLSAVQGALQAELARQAADHSRELSAFSLEQAKLLHEGQQALARGLAEHRTTAATAAQAQREALATQLTEGRDRQQASAEAATAQAAALRQALTTLLATGATEAATRLEAQRAALAEAQARLMQGLTDEMTKARNLIDAKALEARTQLDTKLTEMRSANETKLAEIQKSVNEQLASAVEKQMNESFTRVIDQFTAVQKAMEDVKAVTGQIGDIKRIFSNVKTRGGWGETQVKAVLDDIMEGGYEINKKLREDSLDVVEFAVIMPRQGDDKVYLAVDAKFPLEDYERLLSAYEAGDAEAEASARRALQTRIRLEAAKIAEKYILPPRTVDFAVMYLPTEGLYAEVARVDGLIEELGHKHRVLVLGPSLLPALVRTIQLGHLTLRLNQNAEAVRELLGAAKTEMGNMDKVLAKLDKQAGTFSRTVTEARRRTNAVSRKLRTVDAVSFERSNEVLELAEPDPATTEEDEA